MVRSPHPILHEAKDKESAFETKRDTFSAAC